MPRRRTNRRRQYSPKPRLMDPREAYLQARLRYVQTVHAAASGDPCPYWWEVACRDVQANADNFRRDVAAVQTWLAQPEPRPDYPLWWQLPAQIKTKGA